jgi:hypothetical protein
MIQLYSIDLTLISTFTSILNKAYERVIVLELGFSFLGSFFDSFFGSLLSPDFSSDPTSELNPPTSLKGSNLFSKAP